MTSVQTGKELLAEKRGLYRFLRCREYGQSRIFSVDSVPDKIRKKLNSEYNNVIRYTNDLKVAVQSKLWANIENAVTDVMKILIDHNGTDTASKFRKTQMKQTFVAYGGVQYLLRICEPPICTSDARNLPKATFHERAETWNEILSILRELIITVPSLPDRFFSLQHISFFITLLHHTTVFECAAAVVEEILTCREDPFPLYIVPNLFGLLKGLSSRHLAHFCRVISLTIFEPEDRHILEGTHSVRAMELLRMRRTRAFRSSNLVVEKNQNILVQMPDFLPRLVQIMRIVNHGPELSEFIRRNIVAQLPISTDILEFSSSLAGIDDWTHFSKLEAALKNKDADSVSMPSSAESTHAYSNTISPIATELLDALTPSSSSGNLEISNLVRVMLLAERLDVAEISPLGQAFLFSQHLPDTDQDSLAELRQRMLRNRFRRGYGDRRGPVAISEQRARDELLFHALILAPHQIEIIFVICTLLAGRRKIFVQNWLLELGLGNVLSDLFDRMSWDAPPFTGPNFLEHTHGAGCECNPDNAVRVQVLRLIHNYYDRDFLGNANKFTLLSPEERDFFLRVPQATADAGEGLQSGLLTLARKGLIGRIIDTLNKQTPDSQYRFWLSACIENFLRGCGRRGQAFVTERGLLLATVKNIFDFEDKKGKESSSSGSNTYQTAFDLVGEIIKCNPRVLEILDSELSDEEFRAWIRICLDHLVDSNVFLRSLFLTIELYHTSVTHSSGIHCFERFGFVENALAIENTKIPHNEHCCGYLASTWTQELPQLSSSSVRQYREKKELQEMRARAAKTPRSSSKVKVADSTSASSSNKTNNASATSRVPATPASSHTSAASAASSSQSTYSPSSQNILLNIVNGVGGVMSSLSGSTKPSKTTIEGAAVMKDSKAIWADSEVEVIPGTGIPSAKHCDAGLDGAFYTPPEGPVVTKASLPISEGFPNSVGAISMNVLSLAMEQFKNSLDRSDNPSEGVDGNAVSMKKLPANTSVETHSAPAVPDNVAAPLTIQPKIFRFSMFVIQEKYSILLRLMSAVSIHSINHENICCLNSTLLIMLFDLQRHQLGHTLKRICQLANDCDPVIPALIARKNQRRKKTSAVPMLCVHLLSSDRVEPSTPNSKGSSTKVSCGCDLSTGCTTFSDSEKHSDSFNSEGKKKPAEDSLVKKSLKQLAEQQSIIEYQKYLSDDNKTSQECDDDSKLSNGALVMTNFRELLWYWREYYLRRGRDRLSIEFSSHIRFSHFLNLVGKFLTFGSLTFHVC
jgi:hypothetical protein